jgi:RNA recognition motif-containing protein
MGKLFVGNLPQSVSETDIQDWIECAGYSVEHVEIIRNGSTQESRGFGFVTLKEGCKINEAIASLNGRTMSGYALTVKEAIALPARNTDLLSDAKHG